MLLGIVFHALLSFVVLPIWPAQDIGRGAPFYEFLQHAFHGFRMPLFFLVSGYFTAMLWRRRGARGLIRHRWKRIGVPLLIGTMIMVPLTVAVSIWGGIKKAEIAASGLRAEPAGVEDLWAAARAGSAAHIRELVAAGDDPNLPDANGIPPLMWAAMAGQAEAAKALLESGAKIDATDREGTTALHGAAFLSQTEVVLLLLESGADINTLNHDGETPLDVSHVPKEIVKFFTEWLRLELDVDQVILERPAMHQLLTSRGGAHGKQASPDKIQSGWERATDLYYWGSVIPVFHHLWFLYYLLWMVALFLAASSLWAKIPIKLPDRLLSTPLCLLYLVPLTIVPQLTFWQSFGPDTNAGILPWPPTVFYYAVFFGFGAACFGRRQLEEDAGRLWPLWLGASLAVLIVGLNSYHSGEHNAASAFAAAYAWLMSFGCLGLFRRLFSGENAKIRYLSDSSYWLYLAHLPLVMVLQIIVSDWQLPSLSKLLIISATSIGLLLLSYRWFVRYSFIGAILNGPKSRPSAAARGD